MSMKDNLKKLTAKSEKIKLDVPGESAKLELDVKGLTFSDLAELAYYADRKDTRGAMKYMLRTTLRKSLPKDGDDAWSDEEIKDFAESMDGKVATEIIQKIQKISGLDDPKEKGE